MRAYFFTNMYLSSIQHGIQSAHVLHEMFRKYNIMDYDLQKLLYDWADNHKTIIVKNGGDTTMMLNIKDLCSQMNLPYAYFYEPSLDNVLTCIGIIVPEKYYNIDIINTVCQSWKRTELESKFVDMIQSTRMAI